MVARVLEGAGTADMPVETMEELDLYVNPEAAERMGVTLPEDLIQEAVKVVKNDK
jgi:putative ABC transport system substrate-binding protein